MNRDDLFFLDHEPIAADFHGEVLAGLSQPQQKSLPAKFFYDQNGSELFEAICETPEYYPTRTEIAILERFAGEIADVVGHGAFLIEPGSGNCRKVRGLLNALRPIAYSPLDIAKEHLARSARELARDYPWLKIYAVCMDYTRGLERIETFDTPPGTRKVVFFPGSTIGNFEPEMALAFLRQLAQILGPHGGLLIGVDLKKDPDVLHQAYNDAQGITREFNLNLLRRINSELNADFDPDRFYHYAFYNAPRGRIEMHLVSQGHQQIQIGDERIHFADGDSIHTENSYKYTVPQFQALAQLAGFRAVDDWQDADRLFSVQYLVVAH
jgi:dimethylhistidine N-methyltransferase